MQAKRSRFHLLAALALALCLAVGLTASAADAKKKKKKSPKAVAVTQTVNAPILDALPNGAGNPDLRRTTTFAIQVGKKFKKMRIRDVNVTLQTTGTGTDAASDLGAMLTAPNGASVWVLGSQNLTGNLIGPLTFDDETFVTEMDTGTPDGDATAIYAPYVGAVQPQGGFTVGPANSPPLSIMDDGRVQGTWTLTMIDYFTGNTNTLVSWGLYVAAGKPYLKKAK
jgi:hypothetical protein